MAQHAKLPIYRRVRPAWLLAGLIVTAFTAGTYALWAPEEAPVEPPEDISGLPNDNWHPPIAMPPLQHVQPPPKRAVPAVKKPAPPKAPVRAVTRKVVSITRSARVVAFVRAQLGKRYEWGGNGPYAYDCSGLTKAAYAHVGVYLPRTSQEQSRIGVRVSLSSLKTGDLLFWGGYGTAHHVAIYIGHGEYVAAENPHSGVVIRSLNFFRPDFARRVL